MAAALAAASAFPQIAVTEDADQIRIATSAIEAAVRKRGYVSGVYRQTFLDKKTGFRDPGFGLDIADWILEPGSDEAWRDRLPPGMVYRFNNLVHGSRAKRIVEGPQICTQAKELAPEVIRGAGFVAVRNRFRYYMAAPGRKAGSQWEQLLVFPDGKRYFFSSHRIRAVNGSQAMLLRIDMPGHIRHARGDSFSEIYLSYRGRIAASEFSTDFPPDRKFHYLRSGGAVPRRMIRAYRLRDSRAGREGPWLAGMTLDASAVYEAWCHQRGYVSMIQEIGGRPVQPGESFGAAFIVGYFDSIEEMNALYDQYTGHTGLEVTRRGWRLTR